MNALRQGVTAIFGDAEGRMGAGAEAISGKHGADRIADSATIIGGAGADEIVSHEIHRRIEQDVAPNDFGQML